jgi:hypothetical protein
MRGLAGPIAFASLRALDGRHPFQDAVPGGWVAYRARRRHDGEVVWLNYALAREMGLIDAHHPDRMTPGLHRALLDAFCLVIVNEYDLRRGTPVREQDLLPHPYMATRYLQLQHPDRRGTTSGDGRSVWNGVVRHRGVTWDVTSCGTGVTCLCPATAESRRFYKTGSRSASYGCGTASIEDGLAAALMSETFHRAGIATERTLAVIALEDGFAINVRAGRNLLRPSHLFVHLKQGNRAALRAATDYYLARQRANGVPVPRGSTARWRWLARTMAETFGRTAATFEREYVFCWLDWDGDNVLADGGIIDYGSVRQFGLYHREYRYDDGPRWSTTLPQQRRKARAIVQTVAQIRDFLITGKKAPLRRFARDPVLRHFDVVFRDTKRRLLLRNLGFDEAEQRSLLRRPPPALRRFERAHAFFEAARSARGPRRLADGITWNAVFSTRDLLRELPLRYRQDPRPIPAAAFLEVGLSSYASRRDRIPTPHRIRMAGAFQRAYLRLVSVAARRTASPPSRVLEGIAARSAWINRADRITGDSIFFAARRLARQRRRIPPSDLQRLVDRFVAHQLDQPRPRTGLVSPGSKRVFSDLLELLVAWRHGH